MDGGRIVKWLSDYLLSLEGKGALTLTAAEIDTTPIGSHDPSTGKFTTLAASGQLTSTVATGTAPLVVASTTKVANLNADLLDGTDWAAPGPIGGTTPGTGAFSTLSASGNLTVTGAITSGSYNGPTDLYFTAQTGYSCFFRPDGASIVHTMSPTVFTIGTPFGYASGQGGTVAQATSKATGVTLSKACGAITMDAGALAAGTIVSFVLTNTKIAATDVLILNHISGGTPGSYSLNARCAAGSATIDVRNNTAGSLSEAIVIQFVLIKAVNA